MCFSDRRSEGHIHSVLFSVSMFNLMPPYQLKASILKQKGKKKLKHVEPTSVPDCYTMFAIITSLPAVSLYTVCFLYDHIMFKKQTIQN